MDASPVTPRPAATVILVRGGDERLEVLLIKRNPAQRFMGGAWVFPGGALDAGESAVDAAARELAEEAGVELSEPGALVAFSRWITPSQLSVRFDTLFFLAALPDGGEPRPDGEEAVEARWFEPQAALDAFAAGEIVLVFPTIKNLERLTRFASADELLAWAPGREIRPVQPRVREGRLVVPGEPGYEP